MDPVITPPSSETVNLLTVTVTVTADRRALDQLHERGLGDPSKIAVEIAARTVAEITKKIGGEEE